MYGRGVPKEVGIQASRNSPVLVEVAGAASYDFVDAETSQGYTWLRAEDGTVWPGSSPLLLKQLPHLLDSLLPEWTRPPLVALTMKSHARLITQIKVAQTKVSDFLDSGASVVEEQKKRSISYAVATFSWKTLEQGRDFLTLQKMRLRR
jgi:hypothetical protein